MGLGEDWYSAGVLRFSAFDSGAILCVMGLDGLVSHPVKPLL